MFAHRMTGFVIVIVALSLPFGSRSQGVREHDVALAYLQRHGVPCPSVTDIDKTELGMDMVVTCQDGREWALFFLEGEVAFVHPRTRAPYRWQREIYLSHPEVYGSPQRIELGELPLADVGEF